MIVCVCVCVCVCVHSPPPPFLCVDVLLVWWIYICVCGCVCVCVFTPPSCVCMCGGYVCVCGCVCVCVFTPPSCVCMCGGYIYIYIYMCVWVCTGMNYLHYEAPITVLHRDLKSKNGEWCSVIRCDRHRGIRPSKVGPTVYNSTNCRHTLTGSS